MSYKTNLRSLTLRTIEELKEIDAKIKDLKSKQADYYKPTFEEMMGKLKAEREAIIHKSNIDAEALFEIYTEKVRDAFTPNPKHLTDDVAILNNFDLSVAEVNAMLEKYAGNPTMQRLVVQYADKHNMTLSNIPITEQAYIDKGESLQSYYRSALRQPEYSDVWENDAYFAKISDGLMDD